MAGPAPLHLRVFLSSPGDVADERNLARALLKDELPYRPSNFVSGLESMPVRFRATAAVGA